ncbi:MAG: MerR family transcriptional regulator [Anaerolineae bacterium]|nr:MerR family transcriptional regulator [Anaerolineae bacterium]
MDTELTVRQVSQMTGLSEHTLRYYERIGLILPVDRAGNGHRRYSQQDIEWIHFVRRLRSAGMPIAIVQHYVALQRQGSATVDKRLELLKAHRHSVQQQIQELSEHLDLIEYKIEYYATIENADEDACP